MILDTIVEHKQLEVKELLAKGIAQREPEEEPPRGFSSALADYEGVAIIAEAKKASPSKGVICPDFDPVKIAIGYQEGGAQAMSVLTDEKFFQGSLDYIPLVRKAVSLPVLRKDFIIHEIQVREARVFGADAILLIAAILDVEQMKDYQQMAFELGMDVLVEVHDEPELENAMAAESRLIGINNRNLRDFSMDLETTFRLKKLIPSEIPVVTESGIRDHNDIRRMAEAGIAAALIGETLMRSTERADALKGLRN